MSDSNNPHAKENELMVRKGVLEQKLDGLRRQYATVNSDLKAFRAEAESLYGTSDPEELKKIAEQSKADYENWLHEMEEAVSKNEILVNNVLSDLEQLSQGA